MALLCRALIAASALYGSSGDSGKQVSVNEVVFDSSVADLQWMGDDNKIVFAQTIKGRLYRSTDTGNTWADVTDQLKVQVPGVEDAGLPFFVNSLVKSPSDANVILVQGSHKNHFISLNSGASWRRVRQTATIHTFLFHKTRPNWALLSTWTGACDKSYRQRKETDDEGPCNHLLYVTKDMGRTFQLVSSYIVQFSWGDPSINQQDRIYFTHFRKKQGDQPRLSLWTRDVDFAYTDDMGGSVKRLVYRGNKFLVSNSFLLVAKLKDQDSQTVALMVSQDGGSTFRQAKLPQELDEKSYTVLDTSEGAVMLHVNHGIGGISGTGNVYVSDQTGSRYSLSLPNNVRSSLGDCEFDKVHNLEGVYIANFKDLPKDDSTDEAKEQQNDEYEEFEADASGRTEVQRKRSGGKKGKDEAIVRTVISFDKGAMWSYLKAPKVDSKGAAIDCPPERCWLHLHGITNAHNYPPFYSIENAVGIIMGTGNVGSQLRFEADEINTYLSRDGGMTWVEAHKGAYIYEFGDHGGLILMADDIRQTNQVVFSWNEGQSWYDFDLGNSKISVDNILTEMNATTTNFVLYGTRGQSGVLYHLDFAPLGQPLCKGVWSADSVSSDYETWNPSSGRGSESCILGRQITYTRRKATSECFNGEKFERPVIRKNCVCTVDNFDCELGFSRKVGSTDCRMTDESLLDIPAQCTSSDFFYVDAYRKVVGDTCEGGWQPQKQAVPCPANSRLSRGALSVLGAILGVIAVMVAAMTVTKSERFKTYFSNVGFDSFNNVKYAGIGANMPELALESVGERLDEDMVDDDLRESYPQLADYNAADSGARPEPAPKVLGSAHLATAAVPRLGGPPGGAAPAASDDLGLL